MSIPEHPESILFKNKFYPQGLTQKMIWDHYQKYKYSILKECTNRPLILFIFTEDGYIIKRKILDQPILLNDKNYDHVMSGRTISISLETRNMTDEIIIDVDAGKGITENDKKNCVNSLLNSMLSKSQIIDHTRITNSADSYHIHSYLKSSININSARKIAIAFLNMDTTNKYKINKRVIHDRDVSLDMSPMYPRGSVTCPFALCRNGIMCMDITNTWKTFERKLAII